MKRELTVSLLLLICTMLTGCNTSCCAAENKESANTKQDAEKRNKKFMTDFEAAKKKAKEEKKPVLAVFTGSDWCPWCNILEAEILETPEFQNWADGNVVLFQADFPRSQSLPDDLKNQNDTLAEQYSITGFPTIVIMTEEGREIGRTGYRKGGVKKYLEHLKEIIKEKL